MQQFDAEDFAGVAGPLLDPLTIHRLVQQLSDQETEEMARYVGPGCYADEIDEAAMLRFMVRTSAWLIKWRTRRQGGGVG